MWAEDEEEKKSVSPSKESNFSKTATLDRKAQIMTLFADVISSFNEKLFQGNCYALLSISMFEMYPIYKSPEIKQSPLFNPLKPSTKSSELTFQPSF